MDVKEHANGSEHWSPHLKGLTAERQWYLYESIRPFCPDGDKYTTCPLLDVPKPGSRPGTPAQFTLPLSEDDVNPLQNKGACVESAGS